MVIRLLSTRQHCVRSVVVDSSEIRNSLVDSVKWTDAGTTGDDKERTRCAVSEDRYVVSRSALATLLN